MTSFVETLVIKNKKIYIDDEVIIILDISQQIARGITFIRVEGNLTKSNYYQLVEEINYLLYKQGMIAYVFNLKNVKILDSDLLLSIQNKLTEIFLKCGTVAFCGLPIQIQRQLGKREKLYYISEEKEVFQYINI